MVVVEFLFLFSLVVRSDCLVLFLMFLWRFYVIVFN